MPKLWAVCLVLAAGFSTLAGSAAQESAVNAGKQLYLKNCASCHGPSARGDGSLADKLAVRPSDLTQLTIRNGGVFPAARTRRIVDGRDVGSHGNPDMPVWGSAFMRQPDADEAAVRARIEALVRYLEFIQERKS